MRRALIAIGLVVLASVGLCSRGSRTRVLDEDTFPRTVPVLAATDAPGTIDELRARIADVLECEGVPGVGIALVGRAGPIWIGGVDRKSVV